MSASQTGATETVSVCSWLPRLKDSAPPTLVPLPCRIDRVPRQPSTTASLNAIFDERSARSGTPHNRSALVSFSVKSNSGVPSQASQYVTQVVMVGTDEAIAAACPSALGPARHAAQHRAPRHRISP